MDEYTRDVLAKFVPTLRPRIRAGDLQGIDLRGADLSRLDLSDSDLSETLLDGCQARGTLFVRCSLKSAHLKGLIAEGAQFVDCDMRGANITGAQFIGSWLTRVHADRVRACRASFVRAAITGGVLRGTFAGSEWTDAQINAVDMLDDEERETVFLGSLEQTGDGYSASGLSTWMGNRCLACNRGWVESSQSQQKR